MRSFTLPLVLAACGPAPGADDTGTPTDDTAAPELVASFPEGDSTWTGTALLAGISLDLVADLSHDDGALDAVVTFTYMRTEFSYTAWGTVDRKTGALALAPHLWVGASPGLELMGMSGTYDPEAGTIEGTVRDIQSWDANAQEGGAFSLSTDAAPAQVDVSTLPGVSIPDEATFAGTLRCTGDTRPVAGTLSRDATTGFLTGSLRLSEADDSYVGTFDVEALEADGMLTFLPLPWTDQASGSAIYFNFYIHGSVEGLDYTGTLSQIAGGECYADKALFTFE